MTTPAGRFGHWGPRVRVTLAATAVSLIGAVAGSALFVGGLNESLEQALVTSAQQQADTVIAQLQSGRSPAEAVVTDKHDLIVQIIDSDGTLVATDQTGVSAPIRTTPGVTEGTRIPTLGDTYAVTARRAPSGQLILVGLSEEQVERARNTAVVLLIIAVPIGIMALALVVWLSIGRALRPVEVMRREAAEITSEHLHRRLAVPPGDDEIPLLAQTLNQMLDRIDGSQRQQRQFVSDASHELRSPLATVRQMVEVARRHPETTTVAQLADDVWAEEVRMEGLVKALLTLARLDDEESAHAQVVDLDDAVLNEVNRLRASGTALSVVFDIKGVSGGQVYGDPVLFAQLVTNLISNAARHATSTVRVALDETDHGVVLTVEDDGSGIPPADRERIFERFTRLDEARARDAGGAGLGLAIVHKVVEAARGKVIVGESDLGGARFEVQLPAATPRT